MSAPVEFAVPAAIRFDNAAAVRAEGEACIEAASAGVGMTISLRALTEHNSMAVALLLAWTRLARSLGRSLVFSDVPPKLRNIMTLYGVVDVLPLAPGNPGPDGAANSQENT